MQTIFPHFREGGNLLLKITTLFLILASFSCKENPADTDNLFRYKDYITQTTSGIQSIQTPIRIGMAKALTQFEIDQEISGDIVHIVPKTDGVLTVNNQRLLEFTPTEPLQPDTEYTVTVHLKKLYDDLERGMEKFQFSFRTIRPDFKVDLNALQSYDKKFQYVEGRIESSDVIAFAKAKQLITAMQNGKPLSVKWLNQDPLTKYHPFRIDSIHRAEDDGAIKIAWDGKAIAARETKGNNTLEIPGRNNFKIVDIDQTKGANASLSINFSDPLKEKQNFAGLVSIERSGNLRFKIDGNLLHVYPENRIVGNALVEVFQGIKSSDGYKLKTPFAETVSFEQLKPAIREISNGVILPSSSNTPFYFEAVNLKKVDVRIIKIFESNVLEYLQENNLNSNNSYGLKQVGRRVAKQTINLQETGSKPSDIIR